MSDIKPVLTAEEWGIREFLVHKDDDGHVSFSRAVDPAELVLWWDGCPLPLRRTDALAALCLYEQPFGFTRERLAALDRVLFAAMSMATATKEDLEMVRSDFHRIEALLPPEKP